MLRTTPIEHMPRVSPLRRTRASPYSGPPLPRGLCPPVLGLRALRLCAYPDVYVSRYTPTRKDGCMYAPRLYKNAGASMAGCMRTPTNTDRQGLCMRAKTQEHHMIKDITRWSRRRSC